MNLDAALEQLRDLPDDELIAVTHQLQLDYFAAKERYEKGRGEIVLRQDRADATLLVGDTAMVETTWANEYQWDIETVKLLAPDHVVWEEPSEGRWKIKNTLALNNHIKKLGKAGDALKQARSIRRKNPTLKFTTIIQGEDE